MKATCDVRLSQADCVNYIMNYTKDSDLVATESCMTNNSLLVETVKLNLPWCVRQWGYGGGGIRAFYCPLLYCCAWVHSEARSIVTRSRWWLSDMYQHQTPTVCLSLLPRVFESKQLNLEKNTLQCSLVEVNYACQMLCSWEISLDKGQMERSEALWASNSISQWCASVIKLKSLDCSECTYKILVQKHHLSLLILLPLGTREAETDSPLFVCRTPSGSSLEEQVHTSLGVEGAHN